MTSKELQEQLEELNKSTRDKRNALRKEIAKQKRKEKREFTMLVGKICIDCFPDITTPEAFEAFFKSIPADYLKKLRFMFSMIAL